MHNPGDQFGRYLIESNLGAGGMGMVYLARDERLGRRVALKMMHLQMSRDRSLMERFQREANTLALLNHPNIVTIYDLEEIDGQAMLVMEYVNGEGLESVIARMGLIPPERCLPLFRQILDGVAYAHSQGVIHRDLKPSNVMITPDMVVKVMDFGIAKITGESHLTRTGAAIGTFGYMSPEVAQGKVASLQSDIFSLGVMLYEMLTGRLPFNSENQAEYLEKVFDQEIPPPSSIYPYIPHTLDSATLIALTEDQQKRFSTISNFQQAIAEIQIDQNGEPLNVQAPSFSSPPPQARSGAKSSSSTLMKVFKSRSGWEAESLKDLAARFDTKPEEVIAEWNNSELLIWMKAIDHKVWVDEINDLLKRENMTLHLALTLFLGSHADGQLIEDVAEEYRKKLKKLLTLLEEMDRRNPKYEETIQNVSAQYELLSVILPEDPLINSGRKKQIQLREEWEIEQREFQAEEWRKKASEVGVEISFSQPPTAEELASAETRIADALEVKVRENKARKVLEQLKKQKSSFTFSYIPSDEEIKEATEQLEKIRLKTENRKVILFAIIIIAVFISLFISSSIVEKNKNKQEIQQLIGAEFVTIPAGSFMMGSPPNEEDLFVNEVPQHRVTISKPFQMMKTEVTQEMWKSVMGNNPSNWKGDNLPVEQVSWNGCQEFIAKLNQRDPGKGYRLPTEAEWEYACRAGTTTRFNAGESVSDLARVGWYSGNSEYKTHPVGEKMPNAWGLYDMHGNVWEWCSDWYDVFYYQNSPSSNPTGSISGSYRVLRGGSWNNIGRHCRSADRNWSEPSYRFSYYYGFRVVRASP
ncbi:SUMF1/EgtB/PvdO family nonheme iron enzyme [bacterium]|nr:SUMF1/EgtB/PvdO family nonheme iron enzyme [bacterium]